MKNRIKFLGIMTILVIIAFSMGACSNGATGSGGGSGQSGPVDYNPDTNSGGDGNASTPSEYIIFDLATGTVTDYTGSGGNVTIPASINGKPVKIIGEKAFFNKNLTSVTIPDSVTRIGKNAFRRNKMTTIVIPISVSVIEASAFCDNLLISITIGANVTLDPDYICFDNDFDIMYRNGKAAGTYTRPNTGSNWTGNGTATNPGGSGNGSSPGGSSGSGNGTNPGDSGGSGNGTNPGDSGNVTSWTVYDNDTWIAAVNSIRTGGNNKTYSITFTADVAVQIAPHVENTFGSVTGVTVNLQGNHTITAGAGGMFGILTLLTIGNGQTVNVKDLKLQGTDNNGWFAVCVSGGTFCMQGSASVTGNGYSGVGVRGGTFIMEDNAKVVGNTFLTKTPGYGRGGGVYLETGNFIMRDNAAVSGNRAWEAGGGVYVLRGFFTMNGGEISGNSTGITGGEIYGGAISAGGEGGGVAADGAFTMNGGVISGNTASWGGGVCGNLIKTGGTIYGSDAAEGQKNIATRGHAVWSVRQRNTTAGPSMNTDNILFWE